jgi:RNA polymerase sigma-70 factor (ECF subfamily)
VSNSAVNPLLPLQINRLPYVEGASASGEAGGATALLTERLVAGEEEAFQELHELYFDRLYHFLLAVTGGQEAEAQDALQETFLRVLGHARVFAEEEALWCWLKAIARNAARDGQRKHRRYFAFLQKFSLGGGREAVQGPDGEETRMGEVLEECLEELEPEERQLVESKYVSGWTMREIASATGEGEKALESRLLRLRRHLRARMMDKLRKP